jgi:hypothetical protein
MYLTGSARGGKAILCGKPVTRGPLHRLSYTKLPGRSTRAKSAMQHFGRLVTTWVIDTFRDTGTDMLDIMGLGEEVEGRMLVC